MFIFRKILAFIFTNSLIFISTYQSQILQSDAVLIPVGGLTEWDYFIENHLVYPEKAYSQKIEQTVKLNVFVSDKGELEKIDFSDGINSDIQNECVRLVRLLEWTPARKNGRGIGSSVNLKIDFNIDRYKKAVRNRGFSNQKKDKKIPFDTTNIIFEYPSEMAEFYRGENQLNQFIFENLDYPELAKKQFIQGIVQLSFVVETNGMISNIKVVKSLGAGCSEAAKEVIRQTKWRPAIEKGKYVRSRYSYLINFSLNENFKSNEMSEQK